ncbi:MAG: hypothetical protein GY757_32740, partial [bacterium]|nr:hypothetical protein [bacterium]
SIGLKDRLVFASPYQLMHPGDNTDSKKESTVPGFIEKRPLFQAVRDVFAKDYAPGEIHWVRLFMQISKGKVNADCFVNHCNWQPGIEKLVGTFSPGLPEDIEEVWAWQFLVIVPLNARENVAGLLKQKKSLPFTLYSPLPTINNSLSVQEYVIASLEIFDRMREEESDSIEEMLVLFGFPRSISKSILRFAPSAFARALLEPKGVIFSDNYTVIDGDSGKEKGTFSLKKEPVYRAALDIAGNWEKYGFGTNVFEAVAWRSSEMRGVNQSLKKGSKLKNLGLSDLMVLD